MNTLTCKTCSYFRHHYHIDEECYMQIDCGHCIYPRLKHRKPNTKACSYYQHRATPPLLPNRNQVVYFLTTQILEHILTLPLPPEEASKELEATVD